MICFKCNSEEFEVRETNIRQQFRGEELDITTHASICKSCGWQTLGAGQADELRKRTTDEYRRRHGLLTSVEIVLLRQMRSMSQQAFADFIGASIASVKRWENGFVQEPIYDKKIREMCGFSTFPYIASASAGLATGVFIASGGQFYITTHLLNRNEVEHFAIQQISPITKISRLTSRITDDGCLAASNQNWRNKFSNVCDKDLISWP
jgi:putative zinc finger/helix-turn-helix YgiT family protein